MSMIKVTQKLKTEMAKMNKDQLVNLANEMGVDLEWTSMTALPKRDEIEDLIIAAEQYAYTH